MFGKPAVLEKTKVPENAIGVAEVPAERFWKSRSEKYRLFLYENFRNLKSAKTDKQKTNERLVFLSLMLKNDSNTTKLETSVNRTFFTHLQFRGDWARESSCNRHIRTC